MPTNLLIIISVRYHLPHFLVQLLLLLSPPRGGFAAQLFLVCFLASVNAKIYNKTSVTTVNAQQITR